MITRTDVQQILDQHPKLHYGGYGDSRAWMLFGAKLTAARAAMVTPASVLTIDNVCSWLAGNIEPMCRINKRHTSYGLKHIHERMTGVYASNGQFIVAALIVGYRADLGTYNVCFGMRERSIRAAWDRASAAPYRWETVTA